MGFFSKLQKTFGRGTTGEATPLKSIDEVLESPQLFNELMVFCQSEYSPENPAFLMAVRHFRALRLGNKSFHIPVKAIPAGGWIPPQHRGSEATMGAYVYDTFIDPASSTQVNLPAAVFRELQTVAASPGRPFTLDSFAKAFAEIVNLVRGDTQKRMAAAAAK
ncbi:hypothetical protein J2Y58_002048 [Sphingomonas sp. BE138]|uniref:hypothetical protein n=1 Tax=Sphingomonas sp. BE138 TaxID=2817845 RepID=UPI002857EAB5|nr:hypothetical protein [Sphingomonas sp. BE138]MDR6788688.1 hypothetical protein [Sphingomonas sp. BE138]